VIPEEDQLEESAQQNIKPVIDLEESAIKV